MVTFIEIKAWPIGGALFASGFSNINFYESSTLPFTTNSAETGGAIHAEFGSIVSFNDNVTVNFTNKCQIYWWSSSPASIYT